MAVEGLRDDFAARMIGLMSMKRSDFGDMPKNPSPISLARLEALEWERQKKERDQASSTRLISSALKRSTLLSTSSAPISYCDRDYSCLSCSEVRVCAPTSDGQHLYEISRFTCTSMYPYCNYASGSCSSSPDPACFNTIDTAVSKDFVCMRSGFYPDPKSCFVFYYCDKRVAYLHTCSYPTPYYHPEKKLCVSTRDYCADSSYNCYDKKNFGRKIPVPHTRNYFMYCGLQGKILAVDRCIGAYFFDSDAQMCRFVCPHEGLFLKNDNCANYIQCSPLKYQGGFLMTYMTCPRGQAFLQSAYRCVDRSLVPNCKDPHPDLFNN